MIRVEFGAQLVSKAANVYFKDFAQSVVADWIKEMASAGPARLVMRVWDGDTHGNWIEVAA